MNGLEILVLGVAVGFGSLLAPGPVNVALIELGATHGRRSGIRAGLGVATGDVVLAAAAVGLFGLGAALPPAVFEVARVISLLTFAFMGTMLIIRPGAVEGVVVRITRPFLSMFAMTTLTPSAFGAWVALLGAMPFAGDLNALGVFAAGVLVASVLWHVCLGGVAGYFGTGLQSSVRSGLARFGGACMVAFALWAVL